MDPTLRSAAFAAMERSANTALRLSPHSQRALAGLAGVVVAFECTDPAIELYLIPGDSGELALQGHHEGRVTTRVSGSVTDFTELANSDDPAATLINGNLKLEGDSAPLMNLQLILSDLDIDWEAALVDRLGDVAGHALAQMLRASAQWATQSRASIERQLQEFLQEEARLVPPRAELEDFFSDIQTAELAADRLEARLRRLRDRLDKLDS